MTVATGVDPAFSVYYVAKDGGFFDKHGLDVSINTGPSGSAMVAYVIRGQVQSAIGAEVAGIQNFNLDPDVVAVAECGMLVRWLGIAARDTPDMAALKGKRVGIARGTGSEVFWLAVVDKLGLNPGDYKIVPVEAPEMVAALERRDIDAFAVWEPWLTRAVTGIANTRIIRDSEGIYTGRVYAYMYKPWIEKNPGPAKEFVAALVEAGDYIQQNPKPAAALVAKFLKLDLGLTETLMTKLRHDVRLDQDSLDNFKLSEAQLKAQGKLAKPLDWKRFLYPDLLKAVRPEKVSYTLAE